MLPFEAGYRGINKRAVWGQVAMGAAMLAPTAIDYFSKKKPQWAPSQAPQANMNAVEQVGGGAPPPPAPQAQPMPNPGGAQ